MLRFLALSALICGLVLAFPPPLKETIADLGVKNYTCSPSLMKSSATIPTNVNSLRPADIKIIMAIGDSLTYRGLAFEAGGDGTLETHATIPNILKKYNPNVFGYSNGIGSAVVWEVAKFNVGWPGAKAKDLIEQAQGLVQLLHNHPESVNIQKDWKLLNIFIGGNDACDYCTHMDRYAPSVMAQDISNAIQYIYDNVPRVIVSITGMLHVDILRKTDQNHPLCTRYHLSECPCKSNTSFSDQAFYNYCTDYNDAEMGIQTSGKFEKDDFTVVVQPFLRDLDDPPRNADGTINMGFFAPDCFHFSQFGHAMVTTWLWKNILEPVGSKTPNGSFTNPALPLACPDPTCPFIRTTYNTQNCQKYMTQVAN